MKHQVWSFTILCLAAIAVFTLTVCLDKQAAGSVTCSCQLKTICQTSDQNGQAVFKLPHGWDYDKAPLMQVYSGTPMGAMWSSSAYQFITDGTVVATVGVGQTVCLVYIE
jgi:hypothetical protein